jgi:hypothetical protein
MKLKLKVKEDNIVWFVDDEIVYETVLNVCAKCYEICALADFFT